MKFTERIAQRISRLNKASVLCARSMVGKAQIRAGWQLRCRASASWSGDYIRRAFRLQQDRQRMSASLDLVNSGAPATRYWRGRSGAAL